MKPGSMDALFSPTSVAVVGASDDMSKAGGRCLNYLRRFGFEGDIYPVNPRRSSIMGLTAYPALEAIPRPVDLVLVLVPARAAVEAVRAAASLRVPAAIVCSSGFAESGTGGAFLESELQELAMSSGMALLGPNSLGLLRADTGLAATFTTGLDGVEELSSGSIAFVSQSGALGAAIYAMAQTQGVELGTFVSTGNEACCDFVDVIEHLFERDEVTTILGYVEGLTDGRRFVDVARRARRSGKHLALLKVGESDAGRSAARSHTGALTGQAEVYDAAFRRAGVLRVSDPQGLLDLGAALSPSLKPAGPGIGIVSMSGGAGVLLADACTAAGLDVPALQPRSTEQLRSVLPTFASIGNPLDYGPVYVDADAVERCLEIVAEDPGVDQVMLFVGLSPGMVGTIEQRIERVQQRTRKPVLVVWLAGPPEAITALRGRGVSAFAAPQAAVRVARHLLDAASPIADVPVAAGGSPPEVTQRLRELRSHGVLTLGEDQVHELLRTCGVPVIPGSLVTSPEAAVAAADQLEGAVAVKAVAADLLHKSDVGAVRLGVEADADVAGAYRTVTGAASRALGRKIREAVIQPMAPTGLDVMVGVALDPQFGPVVTLAMGGTDVEVLHDVTHELAPFGPAGARSMIERLRSAALFREHRGRPARDTDALVRVLLTISSLAVETEGLLQELDLNPIRVFAEAQGCVVLDGAACLTSRPLEPTQNRQVGSPRGV